MPSPSTLLSQPLRWRAPRHYPLPEGMQSWLFESGSLTQRLRSHVGERLRVTIRLQQWQKPFANERQLLGLPSAQYTLIREVLLQTEDTPLILARSIIPATTIKVAHRNLSHLGTRPLGEVIFAYPNLQRLNFEMTQVPCQAWNKACQNDFHLDQPVWGRRTVYAIPTQPLLVSEFFLPGVFALAPPR